ncbi:MAG: DUF4367 domain-containing protein [Oscillospiraceae bacterium]|jgi:hypothetical protein|nr:DUF4367 domain-containing protein [Oscillospiraceae bacterium]
MTKTELREELFQTVLRAAAENDLKNEMGRLPPESVLSAQYRPSCRLRLDVQRMAQQQRRREAMKKIRHATARAAVCTGILAAVSFGSLLSVSASRRAIFNLFADWKNGHVAITYQNACSVPPSAQSAEAGAFQPQYLPAGFSKAKSVKFGGTLEFQYKNSHGKAIVFDQTPLSKEGENNIDTEHSTRKEIEINGEKAILLQANTPEDPSFVIWHNQNTSFLLESVLSSRELIRMAESVE